MKTLFFFEIFVRSVIAVVCLLGVVSVRAEIRNFAFHGVVDGVQDFYFYLDDSIQLGTAVEGYYVFDNDTPDSNPASDVGDYQHNSGSCGMVVKIGNTIFRSNPQNVDFLVETLDRSEDAYVFISYNNISSQALHMGEIFCQLDGVPEALANDDLPYNPPALTDFPGHRMEVDGFDQSFVVGVNITSIEVNPDVAVPHPATSVKPAVEVRWPSQLGYYYQVQSSTNFLDWNPIGTPILGDGDDIYKFFPKATDSQTFYRAEIKNFEDNNSPMTGVSLRNFAFHGEIVQMQNHYYLLDDSVGVGSSSVDGFYTFDAATVDSNPNPSVGDYQHTNSQFGIVAKIGNYTFRTNPKHVDFYFEMGSGAYFLNSANNVCSQPVQAANISWQLDGGPNAPTNETLLSNPPVLTNYNSVSGLTVDGVANRFFIRSLITSIQENPAVISRRPENTVKEAIEVTWPSLLGYYYQIQYSTDAQGWTDIGDPILGNGGPISKFFPKEPGPELFYRAELVDLSVAKRRLSKSAVRETLLQRAGQSAALAEMP